MGPRQRFDLVVGGVAAHRFAQGFVHHQQFENAAPSAEAAAAAGFTLILGEEGEPVWRTVDSMGNHGGEQIYQDKNGNQYAKDYTYDDEGNRNETALAVEPLAQGEHNENYRFEDPATGRRFVLRINRASQLHLDNQIRYEFDCLRLLEPSGRAPKPLFCDDEGVDGCGVLVESLEEGRLLDFEKPGDLAVAAQLLADVHAVDPGDGPVPLDPGDALRDLHDECRAMFARYCASPLAEGWLVDLVERFFASVADDLLVEPDPAECRHILNTEPVPSHFLLRDGPDGRACDGSFLDWDKPVRGEVARDVAYFTAPTTTVWDTDFFFTPQQRAAFVEAYWKAVAGRFERGSFDKRFNAFLKMNCLRGTTWSAAAWVDYHNPDHPLKNEKTARKLEEVYLAPDFLSMLANEYFGV